MSHSSVAWVGHFLLQQQQAVISCILQQHFPRITGRHKAVKSEVLRFVFFVPSFVRRFIITNSQRTIIITVMICILVCGSLFIFMLVSLLSNATREIQHIQARRRYKYI